MKVSEYKKMIKKGGLKEVERQVKVNGITAYKGEEANTMLEACKKAEDAMIKKHMHLDYALGR